MKKKTKRKIVTPTEQLSREGRDTRRDYDVVFSAIDELQKIREEMREVIDNKSLPLEERRLHLSGLRAQTETIRTASGLLPKKFLIDENSRLIAEAYDLLGGKQ